MKLLFDQNLSFKLCRQLADAFPDSSQARLEGLERASDRALNVGPAYGSAFTRGPRHPVLLFEMKRELH